jgi:3,4-dihydroxy 2-butanone 4-phosphate synthase/GTP cyclohydrolase II
MNPDGSMSRVPQLKEFCRQHGIKMISVADLIRYRLQHERFIERRAEGYVQTEYGEFRLIQYATRIGPEMHLALVRGDVNAEGVTLVRMHSHCVLGDVFGSTQCDCHDSLRGALRRIAEEGRGVLVYLHQTGPGLRMKDGEITTHGRGPNFASADSPYVQQEIGIGAQILRDLGLKRVRLLTQHPRRIAGMEGFGVQLVDQVAIS